MKHEELTRKIIGCAMKVHGVLGNGFQEVVYQRALAIEFMKAQLACQREVEIELFYLNHKIGTRRADFLIEKTVLLELKAITLLEDVHLAQALNYLEAYKLEIGLLINFGSRSLEIKRIHNNKTL
jgi:GxxExxY protein